MKCWGINLSRGFWADVSTVCRVPCTVCPLDRLDRVLYDVYVVCGYDVVHVCMT